MPRTYPVTFHEVTIATANAPQDLFEIYFGASIFKAVKILRLWLNCSDIALPPSTFIPIRAKILPSAVTHGTGGAAATIGKFDTGDATASFTANANNTTQATSTGTASVEYDDAFHIYQGADHMFSRPPIIIGGSGASFVFELLGLPAGFSAKFTGGLEVEESG